MLLALLLLVLSAGARERAPVAVSRSRWESTHGWIPPLRNDLATIDVEPVDSTRTDAAATARGALAGCTKWIWC